MPSMILRQIPFNTHKSKGKMNNQDETFNTSAKTLNDQKIANYDLILKNHHQTLDFEEKNEVDEIPLDHEEFNCHKVSDEHRIKLKLDIDNNLNVDKIDNDDKIQNRMTKKLENKEPQSLLSSPRRSDLPPSPSSLSSPLSPGRRKLDMKELNELVRAKWKIVDAKVMKKTNEVVTRKKEEVRPSTARIKVR